MKTPLRYLLSLILLTTGTLHLLHAQNFANIIPDFLPARLPIALFTGLCELAAAVGLQIPASLDRGKTRRLTATLLTLFFIAVFPANLHMALHPDRYPLLLPHHQPTPPIPPPPPPTPPHRLVLVVPNPLTSFEFRVSSFALRIPHSAFRIPHLEFRVSSFEFPPLPETPSQARKTSPVAHRSCPNKIPNGSLIAIKNRT